MREQALISQFDENFLTLAKNSQIYTRKNKNFPQKFVEKNDKFCCKKILLHENASYNL